MQVFYPFNNLILNSNCLDNLRLNKQIIEIIQIVIVNKNDYYMLKKWKIIKLIGNKNRFSNYKRIKNHVNVKLWKDYTCHLLDYLFVLWIEWSVIRGYKGEKYLEVIKYLFSKYYQKNYYRNNLSNGFLDNMKKILLEKNYRHYIKYFNIE